MSFFLGTSGVEEMWEKGNVKNRREQKVGSKAVLVERKGVSASEGDELRVSDAPPARRARHLMRAGRLGGRFGRSSPFAWHRKNYRN